MKLLCVNSQMIEIKEGNHITRYHGAGLKEGEIYITRGKSFKSESGLYNYYIDGLGPRLACRFTELLEDEDTIEEVSLEKLLADALEEENYELAEEIKKKINT
jgi:hypothetical protein